VCLEQVGAAEGERCAEVDRAAAGVSLGVGDGARTDAFATAHGPWRVGQHVAAGLGVRARPARGIRCAHECRLPTTSDTPTGAIGAR
jgi:hypothetical protein